MKSAIRHLFSLCMLLVYVCSGNNLFAQDRIEGNWTDAKQEAKINIYKGTDNKYYGKITWLKEPLRNGKPKLDDHNPNAELKTRPIIGLVILKGFEKDGENGYDEGTIYDPKNGKTYSCEMTLKNNNLSIRGYIGISLIGRTTVWTRTN